MKTYDPSQCVCFRRTKEDFGGLSNMCAGFRIYWEGSLFLTSEALYQCARFPSEPDVREKIRLDKSPMGAKFISKKYRGLTREGWDGVRVTIMAWALRLKLIQNEQTFGPLLLSTGEKSIVEVSHRDQFWGATSQPGGSLVGCNQLGLLLIELRDNYRSGGLPEEGKAWL